MSERAFEVLGIHRDATRAEVRRAWRRLAKRTHPDVDGSPEAARRFQRLRHAYREALRQVDLRAGRPVRRSRPPKPMAPTRARFRYACASCDDSFALAGDCPRCALPLHDERQGPVARAESPEVAAFVQALENPEGSFFDRFEMPPEQRTAMLAAGLVCLGGFQASIGLVGLAVLSLGFAMIWVASEAHGKLQAASVRRWLGAK